MDKKQFILICLLINLCSCLGATLRRTPKVYNALITSDENLTSSRAYPLIQPTIHETGIAQYPLGPFSPFSLYSPSSLVRFGQAIAPGLTTRRQLPYPLPNQQIPPQYLPGPSPNNPLPFYAVTKTPPTAPPAEAPKSEKDAENPDKADEPSASTLMPVEDNKPKEMPKEKLPIPLNEFGLPPALIPFQQYPHLPPSFYAQRPHQPHYPQLPQFPQQPNQSLAPQQPQPPLRPHTPQHSLRNPYYPMNLPPYSYNQYPLLVDPLTGYPEQYLPPYNFAPVPGQGYAGPTAPPAPNVPQPPTAPQELPPLPIDRIDTDEAENVINPEETESTVDDLSTPVTEPTYLPPNFESIKNGSKSKDSDVPDVPPPPIPSGAKQRPSS